MPKPQLLKHKPRMAKKKKYSLEVAIKKSMEETITRYVWGEMQWYLSELWQGIERQGSKMVDETVKKICDGFYISEVKDDKGGVRYSMARKEED